jgi:hypothetical protein
MRPSSIGSFAKYIFVDVICSNIIWIMGISIPAALIGMFKSVYIISVILAGQVIVTSDVALALVGISICFLALIIDISYFIHYLLLKKHKINFPKIATDYKIISSEFELYFTNRELIKQRQRIEFEVLADKLNVISHRLSWSGQQYLGSKLSDESIKKGFSIEESNRCVAPFDVKVLFPDKKRTYRESYEFESELRDDNHQMLAVLSRLIKCQTNSLTLKLTVPDGLVKNVNYYIHGDSANEIPLSTKVPIIGTRVGNLMYYEKSIDNLDLLHYYTLEWEFIIS